MIEEVKRIKIELLSRQKTEYEQKVNAINERVKQLEIKLNELIKEQETGIIPMRRFSFIQKHITKRKEYKDYKEQSEEYEKLKGLISKSEIELEEEQKKAEEELKILETETKPKEISSKITLIQEAKTLSELGMSVKEAIKFLETNGVQPILTEEDKNITDNPRDYSSTSSLIAVHKTKYPPTANMIKSNKAANVEKKGRITIDGAQYEYSYKIERDTVHTAVNAEVSSHAYRFLGRLPICCFNSS